MENIFKIFCIFIILGFTSCNPETKVDKIETEHSLEKSTIKNSYLTDTINNVFLNSKMKRLISLYINSNQTTQKIDQKLGYVIIDEITLDTTSVYIGMDFNHSMLFNFEHAILGVFNINEMRFPLYIKNSKFLIKNNFKNNPLMKEYTCYDEMVRYKNPKAWKVKFVRDTSLIEKNYTSVYHSKEVPFAR